MSRAMRPPWAAPGPERPRAGRLISQMAKRTCRANLAGLGLVLAALLGGLSCSREPGAPRTAGGDDPAAAAARKAGLLEGLAAERGVASRVLADLVSALPGRVRLTEISYGGVEAAVKGVAPTNNLLADYLARLAGSSALREVMLRSSALKTGPRGEYQEFALRAAVARSGGAGTGGGPAGAAARLGELERFVGPRGESGETLRELQMLAAGAGLRMTRFAPAAEIAGEFYAELPVAIDVAGSLAGVGRYLDDLAGLSRLWVVEKLALKAVSPRDAGSTFTATLAARAYLPH